MRTGGPGPVVVAEATVEGPTRRRASWNLKSIVEEVAGRPIGELQDPERPIHPYLKGKIDLPSRVPRTLPIDADHPYDPVGHFYPPLVGRAGRAFHGPQHEHDQETLDRHRAIEGTRGALLPGPSQAPERLYLHYLLLHIDRLNHSGLTYLRNAVEEEIAHRERTRSASTTEGDRAVGP